ncbi:MAG: hypothetical protein H7X95_06565 [Deltaproteobacteria bacterium]|nr:hypothetical protein [Deltaproteobacteria bacterium]
MTNLLTRFLFLTVSIAASSLGCGPSIDPAAKADIDRRVAMLKPAGQNYPAPAEFTPRPFAVGQWTQHKMVDDKGHPSFMTYKVVGQDNGAFWVEMSQESYMGKTITKMLLSIGDRMNPQSVDIRAVKMRDKDGKVTEFDPNMLALMKSVWKGAVDMLFISWQGHPQETAVVAAGTFAGSFKMRTEASWGPWNASSMSWSHPQVPLSGLVKSQGIDKPTTMELVAFGDTGATTELP